MEEESTAERLVRLLAEQGLTLGTVECGVGGVLSRRVFEMDEGVHVLRDSLILGSAEEAIDMMALPRPQLKKSGALSPKAARAAAREGRGFLGVGVCVAVWAGGPVTKDEKQTIYVAVNSGRAAVEGAYKVGGETGHDEAWVVDRALEIAVKALA